jgi:hypothetical protein
MDIRRFEFVVEPWYRVNYTKADDRVLRISVTVDDQTYEGVMAMDGQMPFESQLDYWVRAAVRHLENAMAGGIKPPDIPPLFIQ